MNEIRVATQTMFERYLNNFVLEEDIKKLCIEGIKNIDKLPIDKLSRWLGFIQGYVIFSNQTTVQKERDFSRPLFQEAYKIVFNIEVPTVSI